MQQANFESENEQDKFNNHIDDNNNKKRISIIWRLYLKKK